MSRSLNQVYKTLAVKNSPNQLPQKVASLDLHVGINPPSIVSTCFRVICCGIAPETQRYKYVYNFRLLAYYTQKKKKVF